MGTLSGPVRETDVLCETSVGETSVGETSVGATASGRHR